MRISAEKHLAEHLQLVFSLCGKVSSSYTMPHLWTLGRCPLHQGRCVSSRGCHIGNGLCEVSYGFRFLRDCGGSPYDRVTERRGCMQGVGGPVKRVARCPEGPAPKLVPDVAKKHHVKWSPEVIDYRAVHCFKIPSLGEEFADLRGVAADVPPRCWLRPVSPQQADRRIPQRSHHLGTGTACGSGSRPRPL